MSSWRPSVHRRGVVAAVALTVLTGLGCDRGAAIEDVAVAIRMVTDTREIEFGRTFSLTITRIWESGSTPDTWSDRALEPLTVRGFTVTRRDDGRHVEETRKLEVCAFARGEAAIAEIPFHVRTASGVEHSATAPGFRIRVQSALSAERPGPVELPGGLMGEPRGWPRGLAICLAATIVVAIALALRRRHALAAMDGRAATGVNTPNSGDPADAAGRALAALGALRSDLPGASTHVDLWHARLADVLRTFLADRFRIAAHERTSQEICAALPPVPAALSPLARVLGICDHVKFGGLVPDADAARGLCDGAVVTVKTWAAIPVAGSRERATGASP